MYNLMCNLMYFDVQTAGFHWFQCSLVSMFTGAVAALRAAGRASRAIYSKNFLFNKGSISDKGNISDKGSISDKGRTSDKESLSYIISPKNRVTSKVHQTCRSVSHISDVHIKEFDVYIKAQQNCTTKGRWGRRQSIT